MPTYRKRCKRYNEPGDAHSLTFSCFQRRKFLDRDRTRQWLIDAIDKARRKHRVHLWSYVVMPEHAHLLVWPVRHEYDISRFLQSVKTSVTRSALAFVKRESPEFLRWMLDLQPNGDRHYRFWQRGGGHDRNVVKPATAWAEIEYQHANPVRRHLCERPIDWQWSSAGVYAGISDGPLSIDFESLPRTAIG